MTNAIPANWGTWRPCAKCKVVRPPTSLAATGTCLDVAWCEKVLSGAFNPTRKTRMATAKPAVRKKRNRKK